MGAFLGPLSHSERGGGFTLIEILVSLAIAIILVSTAIPFYTAYLAKSRQQDALVQLTAIRQAEEVYRLQHQTYTGDLDNVNLSWRKPKVPPHRYSYSVEAGWTSTDYTVCAKGNIDSDPYDDVWTIDQNGSLINVQNDVDN
jgi:prepilin-type N-terminal cleavage/methylation domain-containing protein